MVVVGTDVERSLCISNEIFFEVMRVLSRMGTDLVTNCVQHLNVELLQLLDRYQRRSILSQRLNTWLGQQEGIGIRRLSPIRGQQKTFCASMNSPYCEYFFVRHGFNILMVGVDWRWRTSMGLVLAQHLETAILLFPGQGCETLEEWPVGFLNPGNQKFHDEPSSYCIPVSLVLNTCPCDSNLCPCHSICPCKELISKLQCVTSWYWWGNLDTI